MDENLANIFHRGRFLDSDNPELCGGIKAVYNSAFQVLSLRINTGEVKTGKASNNLKITNLVGGLGQNAISNYSFAGSGTGKERGKRGLLNTNKSKNLPTPVSQRVIASATVTDFPGAGIGGRSSKLDRPPKTNTKPKKKSGNPRLLPLKEPKLEPFVTKAYKHCESEDVQNLSDFFLQDKPLLQDVLKEKSKNKEESATKTIKDLRTKVKTPQK